MRKLLITIALAGVVAVPSLQAVMQVTISRTTGTWTGSGGEFTAAPAGTLADKALWKPYGISSAFQTFCLETGEFISPTETANVAVNNTSAVQGGVGPGGDPISKATAWLFSEFAAGTLTGYEYTKGSTRSTDAANLQKAIWWLENESSAYSGIANTETAAVAADNEWLDLAFNHFSYSAYMNMQTDNAGGLYGVRVMNLTTPGGVERQDMLMVPEPSTYIAAALLGLPILVNGIRVWRKRRIS